MKPEDCHRCCIFSWLFGLGEHGSGQFIATSAEVTPNDGLVRESPQNVLKSG